MNGFAILQRYDPERSPSQFRNDAPVAYPAIRLGLTAQRVRNDSFAPRALDIWTLTKHLLFELSRGLHDHDDYPEVRWKKQTGGHGARPLARSR